MAETQASRQIVRFGAFEADMQTGELRKDGVKLKFSGQPFRVLAILLERPGGLVTRKELQERLWPDTFVDLEDNLNTAVNKIREALGDSAENPRFVETLPRRGYRFIAPVERESLVEQAAEIRPVPPHKSFRQSLVRPWMVIFGVVILAGGAGFYGYRRASTPRTVLQRSLTRLTFDDGLQT